MKNIFLAVTGASGTLYAINLLKNLILNKLKVYVVFSKSAIIVANTETDLSLSENLQELQNQLIQITSASLNQLIVLNLQDWFSPPASGSGNIDAFIICPCSMGTLSACANGASNNLIERAADVALKERRPLLLMPREAPYSIVHLENMLKISKYGAIILPLSPAFYQNPSNLEELADFMTARVFNLLKIPQKFLKFWGESVE